MSRDFIKEMYQDAREKGYALGHFNFSTLEILHAIYMAASNMKSPVVVANSMGEEHFFGSEEAVAMVNALKDRVEHKMILHADHHTNYKSAKKSIQEGYPSVHIDASKEAFDKNVKITKKVVELAREHDVWVEGEVGHVAGGSTLHEGDISEAARPELMTDPEQAKEFVEKTGVDALAVNIGNAHGIWKGEPKLDFDLLKKIREVTDAHLVLHGGSGISKSNFRKAIKLGIDKVNINSEMRVAYANALEKAMKERQDFTPYKYMKGPVEAVQGVVEEKMKTFGSKGKL